ncbi:MAG: YdcH family protein [Boseongicola sp.]
MNDDQDEAQRRMKLAQLQLEHGDLKVAIDAMITQGCDPLRIQRMKKKKLDLKDRMEKISSNIIPDIIA